MKSLLAFSQILLHDMGERCHISTGRDSKTIAARVEHEGLSFLTITLPQFGKDFQKSLAQHGVDPSLFSGFQRRGGLPLFLGGFLDLVFDRKSGRLLDSPSIDAIACIHQITSLMGKLFLPCSREREWKAMAGFLECESEVRTFDSNRTDEDLADFVRISSMLFRELFTNVDLQVYREELIPKHGPGATAEKLRANQKYTHLEWTHRLDRAFPFGENLFPNHGWYQSYHGVRLREPGEELPVRVITVPKTQKSPRIIAIEPVYMQYMQQAVHEALNEGIDRNDTLSRLLGNKSQLPNRQLACEGSITGALATLDLSEASDRVSNQLVRAMLANWPHLHEAVDACRSRKADVPGFGVHRLAKFASMGSALCFDVEGIVFTSLVFLGIERAHKRRMTKKTVKSFIGRVRVYGDDIIVPVDMVESVISVLESFGMKVNTDKSFWTGSFRESCGGDFYAGREITPVRMRRLFPRSRRHVDEIVSTVSFRNLLFERGYERSVAYLDGMLEQLLPVYPEVPRHSPALGRWTWNPIVGDQICPDLHKPLIKACVKVDRLPSDELDGHGALMKWFLKRGELPFVAKDHLERAGRPKSSDIKIRWVPIDMMGTVA